MNSSLTLRLGGIAALGAGAATASALVFLDDRDTPTATVNRLPAIAAAGVGTAAVFGGVAAARSAEQALRPGVALGGRIATAVGAALIGGALIGSLGGELRHAITGRGHVDAASGRLATEQSRANTQPSSDAATLDAAATQQLIDDYGAAPAGSVPRLPAKDPRVDIGGATIASASAAVLRAYDTNDTGAVWLGEQQRVVGGHTLSIASAMRHAPLHDDGTNLFGTAKELEDVIASKVDSPDAGTVGTFDAAETTAWFGPSGVGEKLLDWDGEAAETKRLFSLPAIKAEEQSWSLGAYASKTGPILYLTGITDESEARALLKTLVRDDLPSPVLVRLPDGAPSAFGVVSLLRNGERSTDRPDQASMPTLLKHPTIVGIANKQGVF